MGLLKGGREGLSGGSEGEGIKENMKNASAKHIAFIAS